MVFIEFEKIHLKITLRNNSGSVKVRQDVLYTIGNVKTIIFNEEGIYFICFLFESYVICLSFFIKYLPYLFSPVPQKVSILCLLLKITFDVFMSVI